MFTKKSICMGLDCTSAGFSPSFFGREIIVPQSIANQGNQSLANVCLTWVNHFPHRRATWREGMTKQWGAKHRRMAFSIKSHSQRGTQAAWNAGNCRPVISEWLKMQCSHIETCVVVYFHVEGNQREGFFIKLKCGFPKVNFNLKETEL